MPVVNDPFWGLFKLIDREINKVSKKIDQL